MEATTTKHTKNIKIKQCDRTTRLVRRVAHPVHPSTATSWWYPVGYRTRIQDSTQNQQTTTNNKQQRCGPETTKSTVVRSTYQYIYMYILYISI